MKNRWLCSVLAAIFSAMLFTTSASAAELNSADALKELKVGKVVWDITAANPTNLLNYLKIIQKTYEALAQQKVTLDMVLVFRGDAVKLITVEHTHDHAAMEQHTEKVETTALLAELQDKPGVKMEVCGMAMTLFNIENNHIFPGIKPVENSFISLIGYHTQGYATIPIN
ncbi:MAG: DsrE family protein [Thiotrichaceae bacterium]